MANIVIAPLYWQANMNVTFALAKKLQSIGHHILYACIPDANRVSVPRGLISSQFFPVFFLKAHWRRNSPMKHSKFLGLDGSSPH